jgi:hypothetical protein
MLICPNSDAIGDNSAYYLAIQLVIRLEFEGN